MLNRIWAFFILISIAVAFFFNNLEKSVGSIFESGENAIKISISILPGMCFFCGLLKVAEASGLTRKIASVLTPFFVRLFPEIPKKHPSISIMIMNIVSNIFGVGNAATAFGIKAMKELQSLNSKKDYATDAMCMFIILNTCSLALFPTNIISLRFAFGSKDPAGVIVQIIMVSGTICILGIISSRIMKKIWKCRE